MKTEKQIAQEIHDQLIREWILLKVKVSSLEYQDKKKEKEQAMIERDYKEQEIRLLEKEYKYQL